MNGGYGGYGNYGAPMGVSLQPGNNTAFNNAYGISQPPQDRPSPTFSPPAQGPSDHPMPGFLPPAQGPQPGGMPQQPPMGVASNGGGYNGDPMSLPGAAIMDPTYSNGPQKFNTYGQQAQWGFAGPQTRPQWGGGMGLLQRPFGY